MTEDTVYVKRTHYKRKRIYHTDKTCDRVKSAVREVTKSALFDDARECRFCAGEVDNPGGGPHDHYRSLVEAAQDD